VGQGEGEPVVRRLASVRRNLWRTKAAGDDRQAAPDLPATGSRRPEPIVPAAAARSEKRVGAWGKACRKVGDKLAGGSAVAKAINLIEWNPAGRNRRERCRGLLEAGRSTCDCG
jgi:hypothetical protein